MSLWTVLPESFLKMIVYSLKNASRRVALQLHFHKRSFNETSNIHSLTDLISLTYWILFISICSDSGGDLLAPRVRLRTKRWAVFIWRGTRRWIRITPICGISKSLLKCQKQANNHNSSTNSQGNPQPAWHLNVYSDFADNTGTLSSSWILLHGHVLPIPMLKRKELQLYGCIFNHDRSHIPIHQLHREVRRELPSLLW